MLQIGPMSSTRLSHLGGQVASRKKAWGCLGSSRELAGSGACRGGREAASGSRGI